MNIERPWAFYRQLTYFTGFGVFFLATFVGSYFLWFYAPANCFDGSHNGGERGIDCGGACTKICLFDVTAPEVLWARSFRVADGQYNSVAYIENRNIGIGAPEVTYTLSLYDADGLITERSGTTVLPPDSVYPIFEGRIFTSGREPIQTVLTLGETEPWLPSAAGRNQFVIENRELKDIDGNPRLEASLTNSALTEAQNVEVVATIFDQNDNALTASQTIVPIFAAQSTTDIVFTWPEPIAKTIRSCEIPTDVLVAIDLSGSMNDDGENPPEPLTSVLAAAEAFVGRLNSQDQAGVVTFATESEVATRLTSDKASVESAVGNLAIQPSPASSFTNTGAAFTAAMTEFTTTRHNPDARKVLVLLTDGLATAPDEDNASSTPDERALLSANVLKDSDVEVFTIGLGANVNSDFLEALASEPGNYHQALSRRDVDDIYTSITGAICEDGAAVIDIIPKTGAGFETLQ